MQYVYMYKCPSLFVYVCLCDKRERGKESICMCVLFSEKQGRTSESQIRCVVCLLPILAIDLQIWVFEFARVSVCVNNHTY